MIATSERDYVETEILDMVVIMGAEHYVQRDYSLELPLLGWIRDESNNIFFRVLAYIRLRLLLPFMRTQVMWKPSLIGSRTKAALPLWGTLVG
jgi:hypothetical protein